MIIGHTLKLLTIYLLYRTDELKSMRNNILINHATIEKNNIQQRFFKTLFGSSTIILINYKIPTSVRVLYRHHFHYKNKLWIVMTASPKVYRPHNTFVSVKKYYLCNMNYKKLKLKPSILFSLKLNMKSLNPTLTISVYSSTHIAKSRIRHWHNKIYGLLINEFYLRRRYKFAIAVLHSTMCLFCKNVRGTRTVTPCNIWLFFHIELSCNTTQ